MTFANEGPATRLIGLTPLELFSSVTAVRKHAPRWFWPLRKGDYQWQSTMWRLSGVVRGAMWRRSVQANLVGGHALWKRIRIAAPRASRLAAFQPRPVRD